MPARSLPIKFKESQSMAIVLALLIVGWLLAFALGAQAGFDPQPEASVPSAPATAPQSDYRKAASAS